MCDLQGQLIESSIILEAAYIYKEVKTFLENKKSMKGKMCERVCDACESIHVNVCECVHVYTLLTSFVFIKFF